MNVERKFQASTRQLNKTHYPLDPDFEVGIFVAEPGGGKVLLELAYDFTA
jgi:hypothetical protein